MANLFDTANILEKEPLEIKKGDLNQWKRTDLGTDYSNSLYTLKYSARKLTPNHEEIEVTATASGDDYLISIPSATSENYTVGEYDYQIYITRNSDSERLSIGSGHFHVVDNYDTSNNDQRSHARKMLDYIESFLETKASNGDVSSYSIGGRSLTKFSFEEITQLRNYYKAEYVIEEKRKRQKGGRYGVGNLVKVRFD